MLARIYLVLGLLVVSLFSYGQYRGIGLFDDTGNALPRGSSGHSTFHK